MDEQPKEPEPKPPPGPAPDTGLVFFGSGAPASSQQSLAYDPIQGMAILEEAESWEGTPFDPGQQPPAKGEGGDPGAIAAAIYQKAVDPDFKPEEGTGGSPGEGIAASPRLAQVPEGLKAAQMGDLLSWPGGTEAPTRVAIYAGEVSIGGLPFEQMAWTSLEPGDAYSLQPLQNVRKGEPPGAVLRSRSMTS